MRQGGRLGKVDGERGPFPGLVSESRFRVSFPSLVPHESMVIRPGSACSESSGRARPGRGPISSSSDSMDSARRRLNRRARLRPDGVAPLELDSEWQARWTLRLGRRLAGSCWPGNRSARGGRYIRVTENEGT